LDSVGPMPLKDVHKYVQVCDHYQRMRNISRKNEMPINYILKVEVFNI